jgi:hypothetical protein
MNISARRCCLRQLAVGQVGQRVVVGLVLDDAIGLLALGDVMQGARQPANTAVRLTNRVQRHLHPAHLAVAREQAQLDALVFRLPLEGLADHLAHHHLVVGVDTVLERPAEGVDRIVAAELLPGRVEQRELATPVELE